jgi:L-fuculose-phosphate aldolase
MNHREDAVKLIETYRAEAEKFLKACHKMSKLMYVTGHGGNAAWKLGPDLMLITPTQMNKGDIRLEDLVFSDLDGIPIEGTRRPTGETPMYVNFFRSRPDIASVLHCHPPYTGSFAITRGPNLLMRPVYPETTTEVGPVPLVPYGEPLTQRLADNFNPFLPKYNAFLMENHGLVIMSPLDIEWCMMTTELLEMTSVSLVASAALGRLKEIAPEDLRNLDRIMARRGLPMFGAPGVNGSLVDLYYPETAALPATAPAPGGR